MGEEKWGLASPPHPQGRTESCTLRILRMLLLVRLRRSRLRGSATVDYAPDGAVDYDASHLWITRAALAVDGPACGLWRIYPHLTVLWV